MAETEEKKKPEAKVEFNPMSDKYVAAAQQNINTKARFREVLDEETKKVKKVPLNDDAFKLSNWRDQGLDKGDEFPPPRHKLCAVKGCGHPLVATEHEMMLQGYQGTVTWRCLWDPLHVQPIDVPSPLRSPEGLERAKEIRGTLEDLKAAK